MADKNILRKHLTRDCELRKLDPKDIPVYTWDSLNLVGRNPSMEQALLSQHSYIERAGHLPTKYNRSDDVVVDLRWAFPATETFNWNNVIIAGGAVMRSILGIEERSDADIFIYGLDEKEATQKMDRLIHAVCQYHDSQNEPITIYRSKHCITVDAGGIEYQFILRLYETAAEVVQSFDLESCQVYSDGEQIWITETGKFAYETGSIVFYHTRRSPSYTRRCKKYYLLGWRIVFAEIQFDEFNAIELNGFPAFVKDLVNESGPTHKMVYDAYTYSPPREQRKNFNPEWVNLAYAINAKRTRDRDPTADIGSPHIYVVTDDPDKVWTMGFHLDPLKILNEITAKSADMHYKRLSAYYTHSEVQIIKNDPNHPAVGEINARIAKQVTPIIAEMAMTLQEAKWIKRDGSNGHILNGSFRPINESPEEYYGTCYKKFQLGLPDDYIKKIKERYVISDSTPAFWDRLIQDLTWQWAFRGWTLEIPPTKM